MSAAERVRRIQVQLETIVAASAVMLGVATWFFVSIIAALLQMVLHSLPRAVALTFPVLAIGGAIAVAGWVAWRGRFAWSFQRVALWIEERAPDLRYALVTLIDPTYAASPVAAPLNKTFQNVPTNKFVQDVAKRSVPVSVLALLIATTAFFMLPAKVRTLNVLGPGAGSGADAVPMANRLEPLQARVTPPPYANMRTENLEDPSTITGIVGSRVVVSGKGTSEGIKITMGEKPLQVMKAPQDGRWMTAFVMPDSAMALKLVDREYSRLVVLDARADEAPTAKLIRPARDTTLRKPVGSLTLEVDLADDIGINNTVFEYIISSGESEGNFTSRNGTVGAKVLGLARTARHSVTVPYSQFQLKEGDVFSIRAVVYDANNLSGPGKGFSESRTIRIARAGEYDSLSVTPAPPSADTALISLRMLIIQVEKLHAQRDKMERKNFVDTSVKHANTADGIRRKVQQIIDETTGGGEIAADTLLTVALDALWEGTRSLQIAETGEALPFLYKAYKALEKFRDAKKYNPRGLIKVPVVNVDRVRMTGTDSVNATKRNPLGGIADDARRQRLAASYKDAVQAISARDKKRAMETLTLMRVEALRGYPVLAAALGEATQALQQDKNTAQPLSRVRQMIEGPATVADTLPLWSSSWR